MTLSGIINVDLNVTCVAFVRTWSRNWSVGTTHHLFIDLKKTSDSGFHLHFFISPNFLFQFSSFPSVSFIPSFYIFSFSLVINLTSTIFYFNPSHQSSFLLHFFLLSPFKKQSLFPPFSGPAVLIGLLKLPVLVWPSLYQWPFFPNQLTLLL
jgi:hypothetical protein